ncbi:hypothetical protein [Methanimicrococcus blatticola]|uniref:Uncharacterized protein n=1 Tax=Methanimicrococcus blatticola TaxID=91560 RepID=A0A484F6U1_9EURY|nr:hypothetical protein [Methanimicrococcus blatticola]MBZ3936290.1 hypothetical protein [Methanimicrococcus blatticola]MCC2508293.1 hypothetical protein [Methanimicrococcus blatticola]TDQ70252.1 hypothetical protein C7391_0594 [Methanimicrococcus blatticola]
MIEDSKGMKIAVLLFSAALILVAIAAVGTSMEQQKTHFPVNGSVGWVAISWYYPDYDELVSGSDLIVVGTVSDKYALWGTEDGQKPPRYALCDAGIYTYYSFNEFEILKGSAETLCVRTPGGTVDGYTYHVSTVPEFEIGDSVLMFLTENVDMNGTTFHWNHIAPPTVFIETEDGVFVNDYYGEVTIDSETNVLHLSNVPDDVEKENILFNNRLAEGEWTGLYID